MNKQIKKIFFSSLALMMLCPTISGCKPKEITQDIQLTHTQTDGTKVNQSDEIINKTKKLGELEFNNISITESGERTKIAFDVKNTSEDILNEKEFTIVLLNTKKEKVKEIVTYIGTILPGETKNFGTEITLDFTEVYDIQFVE